MQSIILVLCVQAAGLQIIHREQQNGVNPLARTNKPLQSFNKMEIPITDIPTEAPNITFCSAAVPVDCILPMNETRLSVQASEKWHLHQMMIAVSLTALNIVIVGGNCLVIGSVLTYKRMRTVTNVLLTSLAISDLMVGVFVTPFSAMDLLNGHRWALGQIWCGVWATADVLLCTASILNLSVISIDRYFAITSPLKYSRRRTTGLIGGLLTGVWLLSILICTPPWLVPQWHMFTEYYKLLVLAGGNSNRVLFTCGYSRSIAYRIYSAAGSFYIPLFVMMFVYYRIFQVANEREKMVQNGRNNIRFTVKRPKSNKKPAKKQTEKCVNLDETIPMQTDGVHTTTQTDLAPNTPEVFARIHQKLSVYAMNKNENHSYQESHYEDESSDDSSHIQLHHHHQNKKSTRRSSMGEGGEITAAGCSPAAAGPLRQQHLINQSNQDNKSLLNHEKSTKPLNCEGNSHKPLTEQGNASLKSLTTSATKLLHAKEKSTRKERKQERAVYARERKALKTIGIIVFGFITCWLPFFILYMVDVLFTVQGQYWALLFDVFLWLGYSNSALNPIIYTFCNSEFRKCFLELLRWYPCRRRLGCATNNIPLNTMNSNVNNMNTTNNAVRRRSHNTPSAF